MATSGLASNVTKVTLRCCACGSIISGRDSHPLCMVCLGVKHLEAATLANPECCPLCSLFPSRMLERRVRVASNKDDPCLFKPPAEETVHTTVSSCLPTFGSLIIDGEEDYDDKVITRLLEEREEDEDDVIFPPTPSRPGSA